MTTDRTDWTEAQKWEAGWWADCINTYGEETKQFDYAARMGLVKRADSQGPYFDMGGKSVLDMGGGPVSMLLKCRGRGRSVVVDPCDYPTWVEARYEAAGIDCLKEMAEDVRVDGVFDEVWLYNVLQHVSQPDKVVENCLRHGKIVRVFEWLEIGVGAGHLHNLLEKDLDSWFGGVGKALPARRGREYFGIFLGEHYE